MLAGSRATLATLYDRVSGCLGFDRVPRLVDGGNAAAGELAADPVGRFQEPRCGPRSRPEAMAAANAAVDPPAMITS